MENPCHYVKKQVCKNQYKLYKLLSSLFAFIPKYIDYDEETMEMTTENIHHISVADTYGEDMENVPSNVLDKIIVIVSQLYDIGFYYPDITGYNFIEDSKKKVWIVDFEHCFCKGSVDLFSSTELQHTRYIEDFIAGKCNTWNSYFK